jgi:hypothetical protein
MTFLAKPTTQASRQPEPTRTFLSVLLKCLSAFSA